MFKLIRSKILLSDSSAILKRQQERVRKRIRNILGRTGLILDIGSGSRPVSGFGKVITLDIDPECEVNLRADAHQMPFLKDVFDLVWLGGVLEHMNNPRVVINETQRILKKGGYIYIEVPFFQRIHAAPCDFQRFTITGLEELCDAFLKIESGILCGPSVAFSHILRYYLALLFSFNNEKLFKILYYYILGWVTLPIKYIDNIISGYKNADSISFAFYYLGKKT